MRYSTSNYKNEGSLGKYSLVIPVGLMLPTAQMSQHCHNCDLSSIAVQGWKGNSLVVSISQDLVYFIIMSQAVCTWAKQEHNCDSPREQWKLFCYMYVLWSNTFEAQYDWKGEWPEAFTKTTYTYFACKLYSHLPEFRSWILGTCVEGLSNHCRTKTIGKGTEMNERELTVYLRITHSDVSPPLLFV